MTSEPRQPSPETDPTLTAAREQVAAHERTAVQASRDAALSSVERAIAHDEGSVRGRLKGVSTATRRATLIGGVALLVGAELNAHLASAWRAAPARVAWTLVLIGALLFGALWTSLRPLHQPALRPLTERLWVVSALVLVLAVSVWPAAEGAATWLLAWRDAWPCLAYGSVIAALVYAVGRVVERGTWVGGLLAAVAAGLCANLVLMTHCPSAAADHMLLGHFGVLALALIGYAALSRVFMRAR